MCLAIPMQVKEIKENNKAIITLNGVEREISIVMTPTAKVGSWLLTHAGFSIQELTEEDAQENLRLLEELYETLEE